MFGTQNKNTTPQNPQFLRAHYHVFKKKESLVKKIVRFVLAAVLLVGSLSTVSLADGGGGTCPPTGCNNPH